MWLIESPVMLIYGARRSFLGGLQVIFFWVKNIKEEIAYDSFIKKNVKIMKKDRFYFFIIILVDEKTFLP